MGEKTSRIRNTTINSTLALLSKILIFVLQFICRTVFIRILSTEYLGINGLFTNILTMLSFAELGIGSAIIYKLYKPIAQNDQEKIKTYLNFYRKAYIFIGIVILAIGIVIIPALKYIVKDVPDIKENIYYIYILFLVNSTISYFFTYKKSIIIGYQKEYITTIINLVSVIIQNIIQIVILLFTRNYILYLLVQIAFTFLDNFISSMLANKMYPFIKDKEYRKISKQEEKNIFKDVKSLILYKLGNTLSTGTDNIIISAFVGVSEVGLLSNYTTITNAINSFLTSFFNAFTASVGNLNAGEDIKKQESVFYQMLFIAFVICGMVSTVIILLINDFITIWLGEEYVLSGLIAIILGVNMYIDGMRFINYTFRTTMGIFKEGRLVPIISAIVNVVLSIIFVQFWGIFGVLFATAIARLFITTFFDPYLLHKLRFKTKCRKFYFRYIYYAIVFGINLAICYLFLQYINIQGFWGLIVKGILILIITSIIFLIFVFKTEEYKEVKKIFVKKLLKKGEK